MDFPMYAWPLATKLGQIDGFQQAEVSPSVSSSTAGSSHRLSLTHLTLGISGHFSRMIDSCISY